MTERIVKFIVTKPGVANPSSEIPNGPRTVKFIVTKPSVSNSLGIQDVGSLDGHSVASVNTTELSDSVLHMARAIISDAMSLEDREIEIRNEKAKVGRGTKKVKIDKVDFGKVKKDELTLKKLGEMLEKESFEEKASFAELLSVEVKDEYEKIKSDEDVRDCVSNIKTALKDYKGSNTKENAKKVVDAQLALMKVLNKKKYKKYIKETLSKIFTRVAVEAFQKEFGDLKRVNTLREMKLFLNKLYEDIKDAKGDKYSGECESSLIYGFGHYPAPVRVNLKNLKKNPAEVSNAVWALVSMSLRYPVFSKNGKGFEIFDTGSQNDGNCSFRAVAVGAGLGPNGYNEIQQKVIEGAKKLLNELKSGSGNKNLYADVLLNDEGINLPEKNEKCLTEWLDKYIKDRENGFVGGMDDIDRSLAVIGLGRPICDTFLPNGKKIDGIKDNVNDKPIHISRLYSHSTALLPLDRLDNKRSLPDSSELESEVKDAIRKTMMNIMLKEIKKRKNSKLLSSMSKYLNFYYDYKDENKKEDNENLFIAMDMIHKIVKEMSTDEAEKIEDIEQELSKLANGIIGNGDNVKTIESKLKEHIEMISQKAVEICKNEPLFWYNYIQLTY